MAKKNVELKDFVGGSLQKQFEHSFDTVMQNMQDVNTPYKDKREINIKMTFVQNEKRDNVMAEIKVTEKLAAQGVMTTQFAVAKDLKTGEIYTEEYGTELRGQIAIDNMFADKETGEVIDIGRKVQGE